MEILLSLEKRAVLQYLLIVRIFQKLAVYSHSQKRQFFSETPMLLTWAFLLLFYYTQANKSFSLAIVFFKTAMRSLYCDKSLETNNF